MSFVRDALVIAGSALVLFGLWRVYEPLTYLAGGLMLAAAAVYWSMLKVSGR